jgi:predicted PurR-regulated permease PerM
MKRLMIKRIIKICIISILIFLVIVIITKSDVVKEVLYLILISFLISYTIRPIHLRLFEKGVNKRLSAVILIAIIVLIIIAGFAFLIPSVLKESLNLNSTIDRIQNFIDRFYSNIKMLRNNKTIYVILDDINDNVDRAARGVAGKVMNSVLNVGENILSLLVVPIISYYFLTDGERIGNLLVIVFPVRLRNIVKKIAVDIDKVMGRYIVSQLLLCIIVGVVTFLILIFLHVDFPVLLSLINAFFNIIPYFGPIFGAVPSIIMALIESPRTAMYTSLWLYFLQVVEGNILSPKITGDSISMHPLSVILLLIIGGKIGGFLGMVLAVPVGVIFKIICEDINYYMF